MSNEELTLEEKKNQDFDIIYGLADAGLVSLAIGNEENAEEALEGIRDLAEEWHDPETDHFENYSHE